MSKAATLALGAQPGSVRTMQVPSGVPTVTLQPDALGTLAAPLAAAKTGAKPPLGSLRLALMAVQHRAR